MDAPDPPVTTGALKHFACIALAATGFRLHVFPMDMSTAHSASPDHGDWEYEYDENETEDLYFTLDLTTHVPNALVQNSSYNGSGPDDGVQSSHASCIQVIDLHTDHPLVKLDDGVYSCFWTSDLGTQFHISEAGIIDNPLRPGTVLDIIGTSQTRLLGRPIELRSWEEPTRRPTSHQNDSSVANGETAGDHASDSENGEDSHPIPASPGLQTAPGQLLRIPRELCKDPAGEAQASFLERLSEIKLKRGEKDVIPIYSIRMYDAPANADELHRRGLEEDAENAKLEKEAQRAAKSQRPQKRRRKMTYAEKGIGTAESATNSEGPPSTQTIDTRPALQLEQSRDPEHDAG